MKIFHTLILCCFSLSLVAQQYDDSVRLAKEDYLPEEINKILEKRNTAAGFCNTLHKIGEPSIASALLTDYHKNTDPQVQKKPFALNATIQPIISVGGKHWYIRNFLHTFQAIPVASLRVFENDSSKNDHSLPVRTPTFMVKFIYMFTHTKLWNDSLRHKIYFGINAFHYSNGQDGYEFKDDSGIVNTYNGNFSEIFVFEYSVGGIRSFINPIPLNKRKEKVNSPRKIQYSSLDHYLYWKASYEDHMKELTSIRFDKYDLYGRHRLNLQLGYLFSPKSRYVVYSKQKAAWIPVEGSFQNREIRRVVLNMSYILDKNYNTGPTYALEHIDFFNASKRLNIDLTWYERIGTSVDYSVFMRLGYYGSDPYNIYFQESIFVARLGIAFGCFSFGEKR